MAKYRQIQVDFWQDGFVLDLTPEEKYFYIYLMTNSKTSQCGIYELPKKLMETETGYNRETVEKLLSRFIEYGKILYDEKTKEIMLLNWIKYNWINSSKVLALLEKELNNVKNKEFVKIFLSNCKAYGYRIDSLSVTYEEKTLEENNKSSNDKYSIPYEYPKHTVSIDLGEEREREEEKEREIEQQQELEREDVKEIVRFWDDNGFGYNNITGKEKLLSWLDNKNFPRPKEMILKAMEIACANNKRRLSYVEGILRNWENESILTVEEIVQNKRGRPKNKHDPNKDRF